MPTTWTIAVDWARDGAFDGPNDDITSYVISANWFLGMRRPYADVADDSMLELVLDNSSRRFSPENSAGPLVNDLRPARPIRVQSDDGTTVRTHYTGWIESIKPDVDQYGERRATLTCAGPMLFFKSVETRIELQENKRTDEIVDRLLNEVPMPPVLQQRAILDYPGANLGGVDGQTTYPDIYLPRITIQRQPSAGDPDGNSLAQEGRTTLAFAADNWVQRRDPSRNDQQPFNIYRAIQDTVAAERGRFFFNRLGQVVFWNRHHLIVNRGDENTPMFDSRVVEMDYSFAGLEEFKNDVRVTVHPRTFETTRTLLYQMVYDNQNPKPGIIVRGGEEQTIQISYQLPESSNVVGARNVTLENVFWAGGAVIEPTEPSQSPFVLSFPGILTFEPTANSASLRIRAVNPTSHLLAFEVWGELIRDEGSVESIAEDGLSIVENGRRTLRMNIPALDTLEAAKDIAAFELMRRKDPAGKVASISLRSHGLQADGQHAQQLTRTIGDRIRIHEDQTGHDGEYFIIGEAHRLIDSATHYETTWYLEAATEANWAVLGDGITGTPEDDADEVILDPPTGPPFVVVY